MSVEAPVKHICKHQTTHTFTYIHAHANMFHIQYMGVECGQTDLLQVDL